MKRLLREPLLHFLLLGAGLFFVFGWKHRGQEKVETKNEITVGPSQIAMLVAGFQQTWQRRPTREELDGLVKDHVTEEVLYREAREMGLEKDDIIIRRRLRQKMEFITADVASLSTPEEAALAKYFEAHAAAYAESPQLSFTHVYFSRDKRGAKLDDEVKATLASLAQNPNGGAEMGDASLLPAGFETTPARDIGSQFGEAFAGALLKLPLHQWQGPVESSFGLHLVKITARGEPPHPELAKVRGAVLRDFQNVRREELNGRMVEELRQRYHITVDEAAVQRAAAGIIAEGAK